MPEDIKIQTQRFTMKLQPYRRKINYYETDQMQVVHHSNYARFLEEARLDLMEQLGLPYGKMEELGIIIPVLELHDYYTMALHFGDTIDIFPVITRLTPVRFSLKYEIRSPEGELLHTAETSHAFVDTEFKPMNMKKRFPEIYENMLQAVEDASI